VRVKAEGLPPPPWETPRCQAGPDRDRDRHPFGFQTTVTEPASFSALGPLAALADGPHDQTTSSRPTPRFNPGKLRRPAAQNTRQPRSSAVGTRRHPGRPRASAFRDPISTRQAVAGQLIEPRPLCAALIWDRRPGRAPEVRRHGHARHRPLCAAAPPSAPASRKATSSSAFAGEKTSPAPRRGGGGGPCTASSKGGRQVAVSHRSPDGLRKSCALTSCPWKPLGGGSSRGECPGDSSGLARPPAGTLILTCA